MKINGSDQFKIYLDRLGKEGGQKIEERLDPSFLEVSETELSFPYPVEIEGEAYLVDQRVMLQLAVKTRAVLPCSICNENAVIEITIPDFCQTEEFINCRGRIFEFKEMLREAILVEVPQFAECAGGTCPQRAELSRYLKDEKKSAAEKSQKLNF